MGNKGSQEDFDWVYTDQPHKDRRKEILERLGLDNNCRPGVSISPYGIALEPTLHSEEDELPKCVDCPTPGPPRKEIQAKYPEIKKLMVPDPNFKWLVSSVVLLQMVICYLVKDLPWKWVFFWAYVVGNYLNHFLSLAIHEICHNVAFGNKKPRWNCYFNMFANLPLGLPISSFFKKYHILHHRYLAMEGFDIDLATPLECYLFNTSLGKVIWFFLQPLLLAMRPLSMLPQPFTWRDVINIAVQLTYDFLIYYLMGSKPLVYMLTSILLTSGISVIGGRFVAEHYSFYEGAITTSYYGPLNWISLNVGYHVEHHDFPSIPGSKLPLVKKIAPEYYDSLPYHYSWGLVIWNFITKAELGLFTRVKRSLQDGPELMKLKGGNAPVPCARTHGGNIIES